MFLVGLFSWWYGRGWVDQGKRFALAWKRTYQFFSIGELFRTLFAPFRQISAEKPASLSFQVAMRAFFDATLSRVIGAIVRTATILIGIAVIFVRVFFESIILIAWWFLPIIPIVGFIVFAIGWVPSWQ